MIDRSPDSRRAGFTLIEMMVTLGIVMVALGLMVPSLSEAFRSRKLTNAGQVIVRTMNRARSDAVSRKQAFTVVFVKSGVRLFKEPKGADPGGFIGGIEAVESDGKSLIHFTLRFARDNGMEQDELEEINEEIERGQDLGETNDIFVRFLPDGTVDFNKNNDISSAEYTANRDADIIIRQDGLDRMKGLIDIRPTGRVAFKVEEVVEDE